MSMGKSCGAETLQKMVPWTCQASGTVSLSYWEALTSSRIMNSRRGFPLYR